MYLLVIIKEVNVEEMLAALLPGGGLSTGYSYPLVTINSLAFASQLITVRSLCRCTSLLSCQSIYPRLRVLLERRYVVSWRVQLVLLA